MTDQTNSNDVDVETASLSLEPEAMDAGYLHKVDAQNRRDRSRTENRIATILVWAVVLSLLLMVIVTASTPASAADLQALFDKWITLVGPLAGAAVGFGARDRKSGDT